MLRMWLTVTALVLVAASPSTTSMALAGTIVVPNLQTATEGNGNNALPFNLFGLAPSERYQQVYAADQFGLATPLTITQMTFRPDADFPGSSSAFSTTIPSIQINLSTTTAASNKSPNTPGGLSLTFASNVGPDDTIVVPLGPLALASADTGPLAGPRDFDIVINLTTPFLYDSTKGNLLLDVRNFSGEPVLPCGAPAVGEPPCTGEATTQFDLQGEVGGSLARVSGDVLSPTAAGGDSSGLVTRFTFTTPSAVPGPSTLVLFGTALAGLWFHLRRRGRR